MGDPPLPLASVLHLPRGAEAKSVTGGFSVNVDSREDVRAFYNGVYRGSDGVAMNSSANVLTCTAGTNAVAYREAVLRRINWFRAMAGVPAAVSLNASNNQKDQQAALMMAANNQLSHFPSNNWTCYTADGAEAAQNSNLAGGNLGPDAITAYIWDSGGNNAAVGHRRWMLYPQTQVMGTGDVPSQAGRWAANATWVFDSHYFDPRPTTRKPFVSWPPAGFVPYQTVFGRWSFSYPGATLNNAVVFMRSNGVPIRLVQESVLDGYGENTVVWIPTNVGVTANSRFVQPPTNVVYTVTISNVVGAISNHFIYTVTVFDPAVAGPDYRPPVISGTNQPSVGQSNPYSFSAVSNATSYQWRSVQRLALNVTDGAEDGTTNFTVTTSAGYAVWQSAVRDAGTYAFRLAHPTQTVNQILLLNRPVFAASNTVLSFRSRLGIASSNQVAKVQCSLDNGSTWQDLFSQAGADSPGETTFQSRSVPLLAFAGQNVRLRFNYVFDYHPPGNYWPYTSSGYGWYIDNVVLTNAEELGVIATNSTVATNFLFNPPQAGNYSLDVRPLILTEFPLDWGPVKQVTAITAAPPVQIVLNRRPVLTNSQIRIDFTVQAGSASAFSLWRAGQITGPWSNETAAVLTTNVPGTSYRFTAPVSGQSHRYYRVRSP